MPQVIPPHPIRSGCRGNSQLGQPGRLLLHACSARNHSEEQIEGRSPLPGHHGGRTETGRPKSLDYVRRTLAPNWQKTNAAGSSAGAVKTAIAQPRLWLPLARQMAPFFLPPPTHRPAHSLVNLSHAPPARRCPPLVPGKYTVISRVCARLSPVIFSMYRRTDPRSLRFSTHTVAAGASDSPDETRRGYVGRAFLCIIVQSTSGAEKVPCLQSSAGRGRRLSVFHPSDERTIGNATPSIDLQLRSRASSIETDLKVSTNQYCSM